MTRLTSGDLVYRAALVDYATAKTLLVRLGKTCTTTELETALARIRRAERSLALAQGDTVES